MATVRDRKIRIVNHGLQLLRDCKVPRYPTTDPVELDQLQYGWSRQLERLLRRLLRFLERNRQTLFEQDWGPSSGEFRKHFLLVYFEQIGADQFDRAGYQGEENVTLNDLEKRLSNFKNEVESMLTKESNSVLRSWLFHHYGTVLGPEETWHNEPGEVYSFVRMACFLVDSERKADVQFGPRVMSFAETFGLRLLSAGQNEYYQKLGIKFMHDVMRYTYNNNGYSSNAEEILQLTVRMIRSYFEEFNGDLFNVVYYSVRSVRVPNASLDDEVMRTLVALLSEDDLNAGMDLTYMRTLIRILLLDVPEVRMDDWFFEKFTINGRASNEDEFRSHLMERFQGGGAPLQSRISIQWKFRIGQLIPNLLGRMGDNSQVYYKALGVLVWLVMFPIGHTWHQKNARLAMFCGLLDELFNVLNKLLQNLLRDQRIEYLAIALQSLQILHEDFLTLFLTILDGTNVLVHDCLELKQPIRSRDLVCVSTMQMNLTPRMNHVRGVIQQTQEAMIRFISGQRQ